ncbi:hypothetical protein KDL44_12710 [bacterium]|nr:hypothetical protein [bacterium]
MSLPERVQYLADPADESLPRLGSAGIKGRGDCFSCHQELVVGYRRTAHDLAGSEMDSMFVLGDFNGTEYTDERGSASFRRDGNRYIIRTNTPGGLPNDYTVHWCIGGISLQQYALDMGDGRIQVLDIAWDARSAAEGGQRWVRLPAVSPHLEPGDSDWDGWNANWNTNCARCHTSGLKPQYSAQDASFDTYVAEDDVGCESCHGGAKFHIGWAEGERQGLKQRVARKGLIFYLTEDEHSWNMDEASGTAYREPRRTQRREIETCVQCHSLAEPLTEEFGYDRDPLNYLDMALLREGSYEPDGQLGSHQAFEAGSFLQSREYMYGVSCADCHDPHIGQPLADGNQLCLSCHDSGKFDGPQHHFHPIGSSGGSCVACHMPTHEYGNSLQVHDHSIRIPRPDLSRSFGTPNACSQCHTDMALDEVIAAWEGWYGTEHAPHFGTTFAAARSGDSACIPDLEEIAADPDQAPIVRATALAELAEFSPQSSLGVIRDSLLSPESMIRLAAVRALEGYPLRQRSALLLPMAGDELITIQAEIGRQLAGEELEGLDERQQQMLQSCIDKYVASLESRPWLPVAHARRAALYARLDLKEQAKAALFDMRRCRNLDAECYRLEAQVLLHFGEDQRARQTLREGLAEFPEDAALQQALAESESPAAEH